MMCNFDSNSRQPLIYKNEQGGCENDPICGETHEERLSDTQEPSDDKHLDSGSESLCIMDDKNVPVIGMIFESDQDAYI